LKFKAATAQAVVYQFANDAIGICISRANDGRHLIGDFFHRVVFKHHARQFHRIDLTCLEQVRSVVRKAGQSLPSDHDSNLFFDH